MTEIEAVVAPAVVNPVAAQTEYIVLKRGEKQNGSDAWLVVQRSVMSKSADGAIRRVVEKLADGDQEGTFVAVPARSWKPVSVKAKVETTLLIEEATS